MSDTEYKGARFYKCALQVNSCGYSKKFRGGEHQDENSYNEQIAEHCRKENIEVVGLADHGEVGYSEKLREYLTKRGIVVFPGFEISSSEKIHMVCLYPENTSTMNRPGFTGAPICWEKLAMNRYQT